MVAQTLRKWYLMFTRHHALHLPEPVGPYAACFLERRDWDHN